MKALLCHRSKLIDYQRIDIVQKLLGLLCTGSFVLDEAGATGSQYYKHQGRKSKSKIS